MNQYFFVRLVKSKAGGFYRLEAFSSKTFKNISEGEELVTSWRWFGQGNCLDRMLHNIQKNYINKGFIDDLMLCNAIEYLL